MRRTAIHFDGERWSRFAMPGRDRAAEPEVRDLAVAPDGPAWFVVRDGTTTSQPGHGGIFVLDPERARARVRTRATAGP